MRIAVLVPDGSANVQYRALLPMQELSRRGHQVGFAQLSGPRALPPLDAFRGFDVVFVWRLFFPPVWRLARSIAGAGIGLVWDNDDDLTGLPKSSAAYSQFGGPRAHRTLLDLKAMMQAAHVVTTPSAVLAARLEELREGPVTVIENCIPAVFDRRRATRPTVSVGWTASIEHRQDWDGMQLLPVFKRLLSEHPDLVVKSIGLRLGLRGDRYEHARGVEFEQLAQYVAEFDVGIAPLVDTAFNRARSNVKLKEYAAVGLPWLASDVGPYRGMGEQQGGRLVGEGAWYERLSEMISDARLRGRLGEQSAKWARTQTVAAQIHRWEAVVQEAKERASARSPASAR